MPKLSESQQNLRRTRILDAAERCFARAGFHRTTMQDICRDAGISAGGLYLYFNSKEALIEGIAARSREEVLDSFELLGRASDFVAGLQQVMAECIIDKPRHKIVLWLEIGAEATRNPAIASTHRRCEELIIAALTRLIEQAAAEGRIAPQLPIPEAVKAMSIIADGLFLRRALEPDFDASATGAALMQLIAPMLRPGSPPSENKPEAGVLGKAELVR